MKRYGEKQDAIHALFDFEEAHDVSGSERLTYDPYADTSEIPEPSPRKKPYVDIRVVEHKVKELGQQGKL